MLESVSWTVWERACWHQAGDRSAGWIDVASLLMSTKPTGCEESCSSSIWMHARVWAVLLSAGGKEDLSSMGERSLIHQWLTDMPLFPFHHWSCCVDWHTSSSFCSVWKMCTCWGAAKFSLLPTTAIRPTAFICHHMHFHLPAINLNGLLISQIDHTNSLSTSVNILNLWGYYY